MRIKPLGAQKSQSDDEEELFSLLPLDELSDEDDEPPSEDELPDDAPSDEEEEDESLEPESPEVGLLFRPPLP